MTPPLRSQGEVPAGERPRDLALALMAAVLGHRSELRETLQTDTAAALDELAEADARTLAARIGPAVGAGRPEEAMLDELSRRIGTERPAVARVLAARMGRDSAELPGPRPGPDVERWIWKSVRRALCGSAAHSGRQS